ncbi:MAG: DUF975 family protein [Paludibacteraceae bacterium]|nr:DUF975 family protein [Paludibacteraceae bacterium]
MQEPRYYRLQARYFLQNQWGNAIGLTIAYIFITLLCTIPVIVENWNEILTTYASNNPEQQLLLSEHINSGNAIILYSILTLLLTPLQYGFWIALLGLARQETDSLGKSTIINTSVNYIRLLIAAAVYSVMSMLINTFTFGIGGIFLSYIYRMTPLLLHDYPELTIREAFKISRQMMSGYKRQLFHLDITFLPWILLTILVAIFAPAIILHFIPTSSTLFVQSVAVGIMLIGIVAIIPYIMTANACFYEELRAKRVVQESDNAPQTTDYTTDNTVEEVESEEVKEDEDKQEESK